MNINKLNNEQKNILLNSFNSFNVREYGDNAYIETFDDFLEKYSDGVIHLAYTTYGDDEQFEIQIDFNLNKMRYEEYIDNELFINPNEVYDRSFDEFCDEIENCNFEDLIHICAMEYYAVIERMK